MCPAASNASRCNFVSREILCIPRLRLLPRGLRVASLSPAIFVSSQGNYKVGLRMLLVSGQLRSCPGGLHRVSSV